MTRKLRVVLAADEAAGIKALQVAQRNHDVVFVLTSLRPPEGRGASVSSVARELGLPVREAAELTEASLAEEMTRERIDLLLNVHSLFIAHDEVVKAPRIGSFNLHPGPLPEYAGLNAPSWAVYHGAESYGVTVHWMRSGIDTGEIAFESAFELTSTDTGLSVSARCVTEGIALIEELLQVASEDPAHIPARQQDHSRRRLFRRDERPHSGPLSWALPAREIDAVVRASDFFPLPSPWGHPMARLHGKDVGLIKVLRTGTPTRESPGTTRVSNERLEVATADEWLALVKVKGPDGYQSGAQLLDWT